MKIHWGLLYGSVLVESGRQGELPCFHKMELVTGNYCCYPWEGQWSCCFFSRGVASSPFPQAGTGSSGSPWVCSPPAPLQSYSQGGTSLAVPMETPQDYSTTRKITVVVQFTLIWSLARGEFELWTEMRRSFGVELLLFLTCNKIKSHYLNVSKIQLFNWNSQIYFM